MRVLFCASEIFPYAKSGGLADVAHSLVKELDKYVDICSVMPFYGFMSKKLFRKSNQEKKKTVSNLLERRGLPLRLAVLVD